jgi:hypothetical protein
MFIDGMRTVSSESSNLDQPLRTPDWDFSASSASDGMGEDEGGMDFYAILERAMAGNGDTSGLAEIPVNPRSTQGADLPQQATGSVADYNLSNSLMEMFGTNGSGPSFNTPHTASFQQESIANQSRQPNFVPQLQALQQAVDTGISGSSNQNLIDLSKPLDAGDVERILKALQQQQQRQTQLDIAPVPTPVETSRGENPHRPGHNSIQSFGNPGNIPLSTASTTSEVDDLFSSFVMDKNPTDYPTPPSSRLEGNPSDDLFGIPGDVTTVGLFPTVEDWQNLQIGGGDSNLADWMASPVHPAAAVSNDESDVSGTWGEKLQNRQKKMMMAMLMESSGL